MDSYTAESVKEVFGEDFQQYCLRHKIPLKKDKYNTFMVPNINILTECMDVLSKYKFKLNDYVKEIQKSKLLSSGSNHKDCHSKRLRKQSTTDKNKWQKFHTETNVSHNVFLSDLPLKIYLYDTPSFLFSHTINLNNYILNTAKSGNEIYEFILKETMTDIIIIDYEVSVPFISSLLEQFQHRHKKFHYSSILKHLNQKQEVDKKLKCKYEITMKQLKTFFNLVFTKVVPLNIFGKLRNLKRLKKGIFHLLNAPRFKSFNLLLYIETLDISCITWLKNIQCSKTQWLILAKFVKWFFNGFLIKILRIYFHITSLSSTDNKRLYITRSQWCYIQQKFIKQKIRSNTLQPDIEYKEWSPSIGVYKLRAKYSTVRPIFVPKYEANEKNELNTIFKFLKQLQVTEYGLINFQEKWKSIVQHKCTSETKNLCLVSCDVVDAFGSIVQNHMYNIIQSLCEKLPETLILRSYVVKSEKYKDLDNLCYKQYFSDPNLQLPLPVGTLYACTSHKSCQLVKKSWLLNRIWKHIFYQRVKIRKKVYVIAKGIVQGTMLSPVLSDIYYNYILNEQMLVFLKSGNIIRYMDDILYVTENEIQAEQFLQLIKTGISHYNCRFKEAKTQSNIPCNRNLTVKSITYIGYKINCETLELEPKFLNNDVHYLMSLSLKNGLTPLELFKSRLNNMSYLKLSKIVLDDMVNSKTIIIKILQETCLLHAKRARVLIKELFDDVHKNAQDIFKIIKNSNDRIARYIINIVLTLGKEMSKSNIYTWNKRILYILWRSYKNVFQKDKILRKHFIKVYMY